MTSLGSSTLVFVVIPVVEEPSEVYGPELIYPRFVCALVDSAAKLGKSPNVGDPSKLC